VNSPASCSSITLDDDGHSFSATWAIWLLSSGQQFCWPSSLQAQVGEEMVHIGRLFCLLGSTTSVSQPRVVRCLGLFLQRSVSSVQIFFCSAKRYIGFRYEDESKGHLNCNNDEFRVQHNDWTSHFSCHGARWVQILLPLYCASATLSFPYSCATIIQT
jgi:hypothetical protein